MHMKITVPLPQSLPNTPYVLEELVNNVADEASSDVKLQLLTAVMKMFMKRPPECQDMLGRLLEHAIGQPHTPNMCIHTVTTHSCTHVSLLTKQLTSKYTILPCAHDEYSAHLENDALPATNFP